MVYVGLNSSGRLNFVYRMAVGVTTTPRLVDREMSIFRKLNDEN
jgi:hypothetical protein